MERVPLFDPQQLTAIAKTLGETGGGLTGTQIGYLLQDARIPDVSPDMTKWKRLFNAFIEEQNKKQYGNHVLMFITRAMKPVQYTDTPDLFESRREQLNVVLAFCGMTIGDDGKVRRAMHATNLPDALARANRLHAALKGRQVHDDVLAFCKAERGSSTVTTRPILDGDGTSCIADTTETSGGGDATRGTPFTV
jgi:hypothetical protein